MSSRAATASEDAPLAELQGSSRPRGRRVAVLRDGELVGVVSRSDLLRALEGVEPAPATTGMTLAGELHALIQLRPIVEAVATLGDRAEGVYIVGGTLRDILLGEENFDIDIAVEGDAIAFARSLASALGGRFTPHDKFGTAIVSYGDGERLDVVTTRTEFYDSPGALPTVERAALREDLRRRDFTINAMAASLKPADFGLPSTLTTVAPTFQHGARVLNLSFIDDPTRIFAVFARGATA
jgi:tRNA nucleotidyltransferase (CCA-adding enzyme)